jgi:DNA-binding NarL/FixJ family response regulator
MSSSKGPVLKVFIVDDSADIRARLRTILSESEGVEVIGASGEARPALRAILALKPHVVILDLHLPDESGLEILAAIKQASFSPAVIVLTNYPYPAYRQRSLQAGADHFLDKSTDFDRIPALIADLRNRKIPPADA